MLREKLSYNPVELSFGTSGLRGLVVDMTDLECYINTRGFLQFLKSENSIGEDDSVYIAGDLRESTPRILAAVATAIDHERCRVVYCGLIPTPALALYAAKNKASCVMVTGSHIPSDRNGIKFYKTDGEVLKSDEAAIKNHVARARQEIYKSVSSLFSADGSLIELAELPAVDKGAEQLYFDRYTKLPAGILKGKHVVVYQHSAVGRDLLVRTLESLGAVVTAVDRSEAFIPIDTENVTPKDKAKFEELAAAYPDNFAIVSTDGDSDRPFIIDEKGKFYRGDVVGCLVAEQLRADFAAIPISSNDAASEYLKQKHIPVEFTRIGSPYVIKAMQDAEGYDKRVGWEVNGGFLLGSRSQLYGTVLSELATRDAFLPIISILTIAATEKTSVSNVFKQLPSRYTGGGLVDVTQEQADRVRQLTSDSEMANKLAKEYLQSEELGEPVDVNIVDGLRVRYVNSDVIHIRPSGNAPQLRVYTNTSSQESADRFVQEAISRDGLLEKFIRGIAG